jgi:NAD+ kinase
MKKKIHVLHSGTPSSKEAYEEIISRYPTTTLDKADVIVALGGDGFLLHTFRETDTKGKPIFPMNRGTLGFLLNVYEIDGLMERISKAQEVQLCPIRMEAISTRGEKTMLKAYNEVSVIRYSAQSANLKVSVDGQVALENLNADGILVSTPAGSTAYNLSAHGPIIPLNANLLALTPISPFRPRRWKGALLPDTAVIEIENLDPVKRPIGSAADGREVRDARFIKVWQDKGDSRTLLYDQGQSLENRIMIEQFKV